MLFSTLPLLLASAGVGLASPFQTREYRYTLKETHPVPRKWSNVGPAPGNHVLNLEIALKQSQFDELERHLYEVSDPAHTRYGQHLSNHEVEELVKPSGTALDAVHEWLADHGIEPERLTYTPARDWVKVSLPVEAAERLLDTKYSVYKHEDGSHVVRTPGWSLPEHLHEHIDAIQPTNSFWRPLSKKSTVKTIMPITTVDLQQHNALVSPASLPKNPTVQQACNVSLITPLCLRTLYGTINYKPQVPGKNKVGLTNYLGETNNRSDVGIFLKTYRPDAVQAAKQFTITVIAGGDNQQTPNTPEQLEDGKDLEGNLDAETILGIDYPTPLIAYNTGGEPPFTPDINTPTNTNEPYLTWLHYVLAQKAPPQVITTSYDDDEQSVPLSYAKSVCNSFAQLGARGVSVFFASGDSGVGNSPDCLTNDGKNSTRFLPEFPSTCPYVTSVGATKGINPEVAAYDARNGFVSGGGFSDYFPRPKYQEVVVAAYVKSLKGANKGLYNVNGRAYPDVAAQGQAFATIWNGTLVPLDGTSASTPAFGAIISLVNDALIAAGKPTLGFLNPWLYSGGHQAFTDVKSGSSKGCDTQGFPAAAGWDAVTGFGTPYFPKVKAAALEAAKGYGKK